jgi:hypothetical protein
LIREMIRTQPSVALAKPEFDMQTSLMILITRFRTLTPVSIIRSDIFSKYCTHKHRQPGNERMAAREKN